jgi:hypothetical protein
MTRLAAYGIAVLALIAAAYGAVAWHQRAVHQVASAAAQAERDLIVAISNKALLAAEQRVARLETEAAIAALENQVEQNHLKDLARASSERARTADQRLQLATDDLRRRATEAGQGAGSGSFAHEAAAAAGALGECGREYRSVAAVADELSIQVTGLQGYVTTMLGVCNPEKKDRATSQDVGAP